MVVIPTSEMIPAGPPWCLLDLARDQGKSLFDGSRRRPMKSRWQWQCMCEIGKCSRILDTINLRSTKRAPHDMKTWVSYSQSDGSFLSRFEGDYMHLGWSEFLVAPSIWDDVFWTGLRYKIRVIIRLLYEQFLVSGEWHILFANRIIPAPL